MKEKLKEISLEGLGVFRGTKDQINLLADMIYDSAFRCYNMSAHSRVPEEWLKDFDQRSSWYLELKDHAEDM